MGDDQFICEAAALFLITDPFGFFKPNAPAPKVFSGTGVCGDYEYEYYTDGTAGITNYTGTEKEVAVPSKPDGHPVSVIGNGAFMNCDNYLTAIRLPDSITSIGECAFCYCTWLSSVNIPAGVTFIGRAAFSCNGITEITLPKGITSVSDSVFSMCTELTSVTIPDGVTTIGNGAFYQCFALESVKIPDSVTVIGTEAFASCASLTEVKIPKGVISIGDNAFECCYDLRSVIIPDSVTAIGGEAFAGCPNLTLTITRDSYAVQYCKDNGIAYQYADAYDWLLN